MADKIEYSRMLVKRTDQTGEVPTVPPITAVTLNQMIPTDLFVGEFFLNEVDDLLWIRTDNGILPISLSGSTGTTTTPTLTQVLFQGNVTNGYNIDVSAGDTIIFNGLTTGSTTDILGIDVSGNTILTSITGSTVIVGGDYLPLSGGTVTGNTYFGATSGITMDQVNNRLGINTSTPQFTIEAFGTKSRVSYEDTAGGVLQLSGDTFVPRMQVTGGPSVTKPLFSLNMGVRAWDDVTYPGYGKVGDGHLYASNEANGLNIINRQGTGSTEDYIRFYAGQDANGTTADMHIQGSGSTRGYIGIGTETPTEKLDVVGNVKMSGDLTIGTIGGTTPIMNLGLDANGLVVTGTTHTLQSPYTVINYLFPSGSTNPNEYVSIDGNNGNFFLFNVTADTSNWTTGSRSLFFIPSGATNFSNGEIIYFGINLTHITTGSNRTLTIGITDKANQNNVISASFNNNQMTTGSSISQDLKMWGNSIYASIEGTNTTTVVRNQLIT